MIDLFTANNIQLPITLRDYQETAASAVISYLKEFPDKNPVVSAATGTGKSVIIARLIQRINKANPSARVMVGCHVAKLLKQNASKLESMIPQADIGYYSDSLDEKSISNQFVFAGIQSIFRQTKLGHFNVLIIDEVQSVSRKDMSMWGKLIARLREINPRLRIIGFSATPWREDSGSLTEGDDALFDDIVFEYSLAMAIQDGYLCGFTSKFTETTYDVSNVGKVAGEFNQKQLEAATNVGHLTQRAVAEVISKAHDRRSWLTFCNGIDHSFAIRDEFIRQGVTCETVTGDTPEDERDRILERMRTGATRCVTNNGVWTTGVDAPFIDCIVMLRHTMSSGLLVQMAGRGSRLMVDVNGIDTSKLRREAIANSIKPNCLFMDFARNIERHGFLDQIKPKEKGKKGDGVAPMKGCPECFTILHAAAKKCKDCGYEFPVNTEEKIDNLYTGAVMSGPTEEKVIHVEYLPHNMGKEGKIHSLRVKYNLDSGHSVSEWICLWHSGFAQSKAIKWWEERCTIDLDEIPDDPFNLIEGGYCKYLKVPESIVVTKDGKYDRIAGYKNLHLKNVSDNNEAYAIEANTEDDNFDIPF